MENNIVSQDKQERSYCSEHTTEILNFYCDDHKVEICQYCLINSHMGHKIIKLEESDNYKLKSSRQKLENVETEISKRLASSVSTLQDTCSFIDNAFDDNTKTTNELKNCIKLEFYEEYKTLKENVSEIEQISNIFKTIFDNLKKIGIKGIDAKHWKENVNKFNKIKEGFSTLKVINSDLKRFAYSF